MIQIHIIRALRVIFRLTLKRIYFIKYEDRIPIENRLVGLACNGRLSCHHMVFRHRDVLVVCDFCERSDDTAVRLAYVWLLV